MSTPEKYVVAASALSDEDAFHFRHPFNSNSDLHIYPLSDRVGMKNLGINLGRLAPGRESFLPHAHAGQEEFVYVVSGQGELDVDGARAPIKAGDFIGFPIDGAVHQIHNNSDAELVYLMGSERTTTDVAYFPTIGKKGFWADGVMRYVDDADAKSFKPGDFVAPSG
jgi:uncharacterized cupin superfamily protein